MEIREGQQIKELHPMKANSFKYADATFEEWQDPKFTYEIKFDGERELLHIEPNFIAMTGRRVSDVTGHLREKGLLVPHITDFDIPELYGTVLDGELMSNVGFDHLRSIMGSGTPERAIAIQDDTEKLGYIAYDILYYRGDDVTGLPFIERRRLLHKAVLMMKQYCGIYMDTPIPFEVDEFDIKQLFNTLVVEGQNEGLMRKELLSPYKLCPGSKRSSGTLKLKKVITTDGIIMGYAYGKGKYNQDKVAKLLFGQYKDGVLTERASFDGFTGVLIDEITAAPESYVGKVVEIKCNEILKSGKLRHPKFSRFREDKNAAECIWE